MSNPSTNIINPKNIVYELEKVKRRTTALERKSVKVQSLDKIAGKIGNLVYEVADDSGNIRVIISPISLQDQYGVPAYILALDISGNPKFYVDADDGIIWAEDAILDGTIFAHAGEIGGFDISDTYLIHDGVSDATSAGIAPNDYPFYAGKLYASRATAPFRVTTAGALFATGATISGAITATSGNIGGWTINTSSLTSGSGANTVGLDSGGINPAIYAGSATPGSAPFRVSQAGAITATSGTIGGWTLGTTSLLSGSGSNTVGLDSGGTNPAIYAGSATPASAPFRVTQAGAITATSGAVGGWTLGTTSFTSGSGANTVGLDSGGTNPAIYAGSATPASAPFRVTQAGAITATSGTIGGWTLSSTTLQSLSASIGIIFDASVPSLKVGNTAGTYMLFDGANQIIKSSNYVSGLVGSSWTTSSGDAEFNNVSIRGAIKVTILQYGYITATGGTNWVVPASGSLRNDCTSVDSPTTFAVNIKDPDGITHAAAGAFWTVGDIIRLKEPLTGDLWASISSKTDNTTYWTLNVVKQSPSAGTNYTFRAGLAVIDYGASGSGFISLSADGSVGSSPNITLATHAGSPWTTYSNMMRLGNLNGSYGYVSSTYGIGMGQYGVAGKPSLTIDTTNGIRIISNVTTIGQWDGSGNIVVGEVASSKSNIQITSGALNIRNNTTVLATWASTGDITVGEVATSKSNIVISSGALSIRNNTTERVGITAAGILTIKDSGGAAVFTFDASAGAEFTKALTIGTSGGIYQGSGTFASPTTGLKIYNSSGTGKLSTYNSGVEQVTIDTDGALKAGAGAVLMDSTGITIVPSTSYIANSSLKFAAAGITTADIYVTEPAAAAHSMFIYLNSVAGKTSEVILRSIAPIAKNSTVTIRATSGAFSKALTLTALDTGSTASFDIPADTTITGALTVNGLFSATNYSINPWIPVKKVNDEAILSSAVLHNDTALAISLAASQNYAIRGRIYFDTTAAADFKYRFQYTGTIVLMRSLIAHIVPGTTAKVPIFETAFPTTTVSVVGAGTNGGYIEFDMIVQGNAAGSFVFQWAQDTSTAANTIVRSGSYIEYMLIA